MMMSTLSCTSSAARFGNRSAIPLSRTVLNGDVPALDIAKVAQPLLKCLDTCRRARTGCRITNSWHLFWLLRFGWMDKYENDNSEYGDQDFFIHWFLLITVACYLVPHACSHLITLSARASTFGGIVRPICLAAFKLITNSNLVGRSTGKSVGFVPLDINCQAPRGRNPIWRVGHQATSVDPVLV